MKKSIKAFLGMMAIGIIVLFTVRSTLAYPINLGITILHDQHQFGIIFFTLILFLPVITCVLIPAGMNSYEFFQRRKKKKRS